MKNIKIRQIKNKKELEQVFKVRDIVFIQEQKVPKNIEKDEFDTTATHFILLYEKKPIGCARVRFVDRKAKLERITILKKYRGKGFGKLIMEYLIEYCKNKKAKEIFINSQYYLKNYYKKFGFIPKGNTFIEAGIKHIKMHLR